MPIQNYLKNQNDQNTLLFTKFLLKPGEEWGHLINLLNFFDRPNENRYLKIREALLNDIESKLKGAQADNKDLVEAKTILVKPLHDFFGEFFIWNSGEYTMSVNIETDIYSANITKSYQFTIFESHEERLKAICEHYKFGGGVIYDPKIQTNVVLEIKDAP